MKVNIIIICKMTFYVMTIIIPIALHMVDGSWGAVCMQDQVPKLFDRRLGGRPALGYLVI